MHVTPTAVLAVYGAVVSTVALAWHIFRDVTDRGRLRVHCYLGRVLDPADAEDNRTHLIYHVTNVGRRPVMVTHVGGRRRADPGDPKTAFMITTRKLPKMLQPGEYVIEHTPDLVEFASRVMALHAIDSHDRRYRAPVRDLRAIRNHLRAPAS